MSKFAMHLGKLLNNTPDTTFYKRGCFRWDDPACLRLAKVGQAHGAEKLADTVTAAVRALRDKAPELVANGKLLDFPDVELRHRNLLLLDMVVSLVYRLTKTGDLEMQKLVDAASKTLDYEYVYGMNTEVMLGDFNREFFNDMNVEKDEAGVPTGLAMILGGSVPVTKKVSQEIEVPVAVTTAVATGHPMPPGLEDEDVGPCYFENGEWWCDIDDMPDNPNNASNENPDDDYSDLATMGLPSNDDPTKMRGNKDPVKLRIGLDHKVTIIGGNRRKKKARLLGIQKLKVKILWRKEYTDLDCDEEFVMDNRHTRPRLNFMEYSEAYLLWQIQTKKAMLRNVEGGKASDICPYPVADAGKAVDMVAAILNKGRQGRLLTGKGVGQKVDVFKAYLQAKAAGDIDKAKAIEAAANTGVVAHARRVAGLGASKKKHDADAAPTAGEMATVGAEPMVGDTEAVETQTEIVDKKEVHPEVPKKKTVQPQESEATCQKLMSEAVKVFLTTIEKNYGLWPTEAMGSIVANGCMKAAILTEKRSCQFCHEVV